MRAEKVWCGLGVAMLLLVAIALADEGKKAEPKEGKPAWQRMLQGNDAKKAAKLKARINEAMLANQWSDATTAAKELAAMREAKQGKDHWQAVDARFHVVALVKLQAAPEEKRNAYVDNLAVRKQAYLLEEKGNHTTALPMRKQLLEFCRDALGEEHPDTATSYNLVASNLNAQGKYKEAEIGYRLALTIRRKVLGEEHLDTATSYSNVGANHGSQGRYKQAEVGLSKALAICVKLRGEEHSDTARNYNNLAMNRNAQGRYEEAEQGLSKALTINRKVLGEKHATTAMSYNNLANNQDAQWKYKEAEVGHRTALAIRLEILGEAHPSTALSYNNVAYNLNSQGKYKEAEVGHRKALTIRRKVLGEEHPMTSQSYNNLAYTQNAQGKFTEAEENFLKSLAIHRKVLGEEHPHTALSYNNLAYNQNSQGSYKAAEVGYSKALTIKRKVLGEEHPSTALSYNNLAHNLVSQRKHKEAEEGLRKALAINRKILGESHFATATSYNNLAGNQEDQGQLEEAEVGYLKALAIRRTLLGEGHPFTARSYGNVAANQEAQGKFKDAEIGYLKALAINRKALDDKHPSTATSYLRLAANQTALGKYKLAEDAAAKAADIFAQTRLHITPTGLERATVTGDRSPLPLLAALIARNEKHPAAWTRFEESLGRGTGDDFDARIKRPESDRLRQSMLLADLRRIEGRLEKFAAIKKPGAAEEADRESLLTQLRKQQDALADLGRELETKYGPVEGKVFDIATLQKALPPDAAFLGWLDREGHPKAADPNGDHWAILLKAKGDPVWVRLPGTGAKNAWTAADDELPAKMRNALIQTSADWADLAQRLRAQRLAPLDKHLEGVKQLIVLPSTAMDGVPVEVIADGFTVSYAPSASMFAYLKQQAKSKNTGLVALGDPNFRYPDQPELPLPPGGVLLTAVLPGSVAAKSGLRTGDVVLIYGETKLNTLADLQKAIDVTKVEARLRVWRLERDAVKAKEMTLSVPAGKLGVAVAPESAPKALAEQRKTDKLLASRDSTNWQDLPGTRYEVSALKKLFAAEKPTVLFGTEACETRLAALAKDGTLKKARFVHLATHGEARTDKPLASRIILSRDRLKENQRGELTAAQVLSDWQLDADLVTLSACQTGLGAYSPGEGFVGFAQALLLTGSRSVCLSRWSVNDLSTALLMERFYENLLGKRGLKAPLGKAAALAEAKQWLRTLPRAEALKRAEAIGVGVARGPGAKELPRIPVPEGPKDKPPYAHPYYWAGFVLVGDRD